MSNQQTAHGFYHDLEEAVVNVEKVLVSATGELPKLCIYLGQRERQHIGNMPVTAGFNGNKIDYTWKRSPTTFRGHKIFYVTELEHFHITPAP